jgi:hypothetical protein
MENNSLKIVITDESTAIDLLKNSKIEALLILQNGFQNQIENMKPQNIIHLGVHIHSPNIGFVKELVASEVNRFISNHYALSLTFEELQKQGISPREDLVESVLATADANWSPPLATYEFFWVDAPLIERTFENPVPPTPRVYHGSILLFIMLIILFGGSFMADDIHSGISQRFLASPNGYFKNHILNFLAIFLGSSLLVSLMILFIDLLFDIQLIQGFSILVIYILYSTFVILFAFLLTLALKSSFTLQAITAPLSILLSFAGGSFFNMTEASRNANTLSLFTPQGWALKGLTTIFSEAVIFFISSISIFLFIFYWESKKRKRMVLMTPSNS